MCVCSRYLYSSCVSIVCFATFFFASALSMASVRDAKFVCSVASAPLASAVDTAAKKVAFAKIDEIIASIDGGRGKLVQGCDTILGELAGVSLSYPSYLQPRTVGVHPENRDKYGLNTENVHGLGKDILRMGFSGDLCAQALAIEAADGGKAFEVFNDTLVKGNVRLAPVEPGSLKFASLACSHTNAFLRCIAAGCPSDDKYAAENGRFCVSKIERYDAPLASAVVRGLNWTVLKAEVGERFPTLPKLLQQARNAPGSACRLENEVQVMLSMQQQASAEQALTGGNPDYDRIMNAVARTKPPCADDLKELLRFVVVCSGGSDGALLKDLADFHREGVQSENRSVRGIFFKDVADWNVGKVFFLKIALVKTQYTCPDTRVVRKECLYISSSDMASAAKTRKSDIASAELVLKRFRELCSGPEWEKLSAVERVRFLSKLDVTFGRWLMGKNKDLPEKFRGVSHIVEHILKWGQDELKLNIPGLGVFQQELATQAAKQPTASASTVCTSTASQASAKAAPQHLRLQEMSVVNAETTLRQHKLEIGMAVSNNRNQVANIVSTRGDVVVYTLLEFRASEPLAETHDCEMDAESFVAEFAPHNPAEVVHKGWPQAVPSANLDYKMAILRAQTLSALHEASAKLHRELESKFEVMSKPKCVKASASIAKLSLCLVPETAKILAFSSKFKNSPPSDPALQVHFDPIIEKDGRVFLQPNTSADFVCPAWHVEKCTSKASANMQWTTMVVNLYNIVEMFDGAKLPSGKQRKDAAGSVKVTIPVLTNHKDIKKGEHLVIFQEKQKTTEKRTALSLGVVVGEAIKKTKV